MSDVQVSSEITRNSNSSRRRGIFILLPLLFLLSGTYLVSYAGWNYLSQTWLIGKIFFFKPSPGLSEKKFLINKQYMVRPKLGSYLGKILIPSIALEYPLVHGDDAQDLRKGVGHDPGTTLPGEDGNVILSGHRDTVFRNLGNVKIGDMITLETFYGTFSYQASNIRIVDGEDRTVIVSSEKEMLTIYTCYPFNYIGSAPKRYVITADFVNSLEASELKIDEGDQKNESN